MQLIESGMETAWRYTWDEMSLRLARVILARLP
jgi:hypothetical protein